MHNYSNMTFGVVNICLFIFLIQPFGTNTAQVKDETVLLPADRFKVIVKPRYANVRVSWWVRGYSVVDWRVKIFRSDPSAGPDPVVEAYSVKKKYITRGLLPKTDYTVFVTGRISNGTLIKAVPVSVTTNKEKSSKPSATTARPDSTRPPSSLPDGSAERAKKKGISFLSSTTYFPHVTTVENRRNGSIKNESMPVITERSQREEASGSFGVAKWAGIVVGSSAGLLLFIFVVSYTMHKSQKQSDEYVLRKRSRREDSLKVKLETKRDVEMDETQMDVLEEGNNKTKAKKEASKFGPTLHPPGFLEATQSRTCNSRNAAQSVYSWGSEFDGYEENLYSNGGECTAQSKQIMQSQPGPPPLKARGVINPSHEESIYGNTITRSTREPASSMTAPQSIRQHYPAATATTMLPPNYNSIETSQSPDMNRVIQPPKSDARGGEVYKNVNDLSHLYVN